MLEVQNTKQEDFLPEFDNEESITFEPGELKYFIAEVKEMIDKKEIIDLPKAIHNAKYFAEIARRRADIKAGRNIVSFTEEEWENFVNAQDIS